MNPRFLPQVTITWLPGTLRYDTVLLEWKLFYHNKNSLRNAFILVYMYKQQCCVEFFMLVKISVTQSYEPRSFYDSNSKLKEASAWEPATSPKVKEKHTCWIWLSSRGMKLLWGENAAIFGNAVCRVRCFAPPNPERQRCQENPHKAWPCLKEKTLSPLIKCLLSQGLVDLSHSP